MSERLIVSLTSYRPRLGNLPAVLDTIFAQTLPPDLVVLNLAHGEALPAPVAHYLEGHRVEVNRVDDTKVYKKLIPTLRRYPTDAVVTIDDDLLYPADMLQRFADVHARCPSFPIAGTMLPYGNLLACHCGYASLTKAEYIGQWIDGIDAELMSCCTSDDLVYTYLSALNGHPYITTPDVVEATPYNEGDSWSVDVVGSDGMADTLSYLQRRFGPLAEPFASYLGDSDLARTFASHRRYELLDVRHGQELMLRSSGAYRLGKALLRPLTVVRAWVSARRTDGRQRQNN